MTASTSRACLIAALLLGLGTALGACGGGSDGPTCTPSAESCNGRDDDCDGQVDEGFDAGAACTVGVGACQASGHKVCTSSGAATICDATAGAPSAEACNGIDDDCDGSVDEGLADCCVPAATRACGAGVGVCAVGTQTCSAARAWGECLDGVGAAVIVPGAQAEACNGLDDDCDGQVDEQDAADCAPFHRDADQDGFGAPETLCLCGPAGQFTATQGDDCDDANPQVHAGAAEACNGLDDDCDGQVDEGIPATGSCSAGVGACRATGAVVCAAGALTCDATPLPPGTETCNGLDDDCDGQADEGIAARACYTGPQATLGVGRCASGTQTCAGGAFGDCQGEVLPQPEVCNGVDDDCDGQVDQGIAASGSCSAGVGACLRSGQLTCQGGSFACSAVPGVPGPEVCNGLDDDCDGTTDEVAPQACYTGPAGTAGVGACHQGSQACSSGAFGACVDEVVPVAETCNGVDDDCDGQVDETGAAGCTTWYVDNDNDGWGISSSACLCAATGVYRATRPGDCDDSDAGVNPGATEVCNGRDDDCDASIDENLFQVCPLQQGVCVGSTVACVGGTFPACGPAQYGPFYSVREIICDGEDNNCNGTVDEGSPLICP